MTDRDAAQRAAEALTTGTLPADEDARAHLSSLFALVDLLPRPDQPLRMSESVENTSSEPPRGIQAQTVAVPLPALVALLVAVVFVTVLLFLPRGKFSPEEAIQLVPTGAAPDAEGTILTGNGDYLVFASGLSELESGYRYVLWSITDSTSTRIASLVSLGNGRFRHSGSGEIDPHVEITIEASTGTLDPEGPTVLIGLGGAR